MGRWVPDIADVDVFVASDAEKKNQVPNLWDMGFEGVNFDIKVFETHLSSTAAGTQSVYASMDGAMRAVSCGLAQGACRRA